MYVSTGLMKRLGLADQLAPKMKLVTGELVGEAAEPGRFRGIAPSDQPLPAYSLSSLERYQDCPFKFFAADVLRLEEAPEDESTLSPRARGRFIHEVFQRFFEAWDANGHGTITTDRLDAARARG